ncbi:SNARE domain containing protein [Trichomonas vaginalis G3]|uniref:SNARE domain containing protein n=1 Tax=Trichomonas vaginalis (strain ATCC PRA-98 / G3) TaxID=412133 RepID=A2DB44_TRIV3|nr:Golgi SNARE BET1-related family [Trichomonas vaginalis G3]EAY22374.1 SNARE domain containing protein [Trichomonas vaginalis G3]KAI5517699.1 Golgi SNARE BET1-related family [Trichomonas vaginalis G3]|eukprot:XP_001583360.1 SNARE domain containing protein [Trichomonas vaginalis G3]
MSRKTDPIFRGNKQADPENPLVDQFDDQVDTLQQTIGALKQVSNALGEELERHNTLLDQMQNSFQKSEDLVNRLLSGVDEIFKKTGLSPTTLTFLFVLGVILFLWLYWKIFA